MNKIGGDYDMANKNVPSADLARYGGRGQTAEINAAGLSGVVARAADALEKRHTVERVNLGDMNEVYKRTVEYLRDCSAHSELPDVAHLAAWFGYSRRGLYQYADRHPESGFAGFLKDVSDDFGAVTMQAAMNGFVATIPAIFSTKARYGWTEGVTQLQIVQQPSRFDRLSDEEKLELYDKYSELLDDGDIDDGGPT